MHSNNQQKPIRWAQNLLEKKKFYILDTETTGISDVDEVIQVGIVDGHGAVVMESLIRPTLAVSPEASAVHGISEDDLVEAQPFQRIYARLSAMLAGQLVVAYNADFDRRMLDQTCQRYGLPLLRAARWDCAMKNYAQYYGQRNGRGNYRWQKLTDACVQQGITIGRAHTAAADCLMTYQLIRKMAGEL